MFMVVLINIIFVSYNDWKKLFKTKFAMFTGNLNEPYFLMHLTNLMSKSLWQVSNTHYLTNLSLATVGI